MGAQIVGFGGQLMGLKYVSLFTGAGGLDIGLERAGFEPLALNEIERVFCETLRYNQGWSHVDGRQYFASANIINADVRDLAASDLGVVGDLDLLVGGPPCQAFSSAGKQLSVLDPRGALVSEFCRLVDEIRPKMFLFENVRGLVTARDAKGEPGGVIVELINILQDLGYSCRATLLNSADYGAFQRRVRCFIIGSRNGEAPDFPQPTHKKGGGLFDTPWRTLKEFLQTHADLDESSHVFPSTELAAKLKDIPNGSGIKSPGRAEATRPGGHWGYRQGTFVADLDTPARTVTGSSSQDWVRWNGVLRRLTLREVSELQGFPSDWQIEGSKAQRFKQVGNAVPTVFGEALGRILQTHLDSFPNSAPVRMDIPKSFKGYMDYARKDHERNHESRTVHKRFNEAAEGKAVRRAG